MDICAYSLSCIIQRVYAHTHTHTHTPASSNSPLSAAISSSSSAVCRPSIKAVWLHSSGSARLNSAAKPFMSSLLTANFPLPLAPPPLRPLKMLILGLKGLAPPPFCVLALRVPSGDCLFVPVSTLHTGCRLSGENGAIGYSVRERVLRESIQQVVGIKLRSVVAHATQRRPTFNVLALWVEDGQMNDQHEAFVEQAA
eukprot:scaffold50503_cov19-Tisochrysis_lutea.AAC.1